MSARRPNGDGSIYRRKDGRYEAAAWVTAPAGDRKRVRVYGRSRDDARRSLSARLSEVERGAPVGGRRWRLAEYLTYWLKIAERNHAGTTMVSYESIVRIYLAPGLGKVQLGTLTVSQLQRYLNGQLDGGVSVRTVQKIRTVLSAALSLAQREDLLVRNVAHHVVLPTWQRQDIQPWSAAQLSRFLEQAADDPLHAAFVLLALYGLRAGEVLGLRWEDVDFAENRLHIRQQVQRYGGHHHFVPTKTRAGRRDLPLLATARSSLETHQSRSDHVNDLVFQTKFNNPIESGNLRRSLSRISKQAGLPQITVHHLRHTAATLLKNLGVPPRDAQLILGHATVVTTQQLYQHADLTGQISALEQLEETLTKPVPAAARSRQMQPSPRPYLRSKSIPNFGGSSQTRTGDTRLFSSVCYTVPTDMTEVVVLARARRRVTLLGGAAVICSRQVN